MRNRWKRIAGCIPWLVILLGMDGFASVLLWLIDAEAFLSISLLLVLVSAGLFLGTVLYTGYREEKRERAFDAFLKEPDRKREEELVRCSPAYEEEKIRLLASLLREQDRKLNEARMELDDYEEYVEAWAHEVKTPLSLLVMILDNREDEMLPAVAERLNYIRSSLSENIDRILYYARLKSVNKDYLFEFLNIRECVEEVLEDYRPLLEEKQFEIHMDVPDRSVFTDQRGILFLLGQIISNTVKYCSDHPKLWITFREGETESLLTVRDNGIGIKSCDLPYIFEKGFTGDSQDSRKKATGMGLYLSGKMAENLKIRLEAVSEEGKGTEIRIFFPRLYF